MFYLEWMWPQLIGKLKIEQDVKFYEENSSALFSQHCSLKEKDLEALVHNSVLQHRLELNFSLVVTSGSS